MWQNIKLGHFIASLSPSLRCNGILSFPHHTVSKRRPPSTLGGSENNITSVSVKILYFDFDETLFHSRAISVSVKVTNILKHFFVIW